MDSLSGRQRGNGELFLILADGGGWKKTSDGKMDTRGDLQARCGWDTISSGPGWGGHKNSNHTRKHPSQGGLTTREKDLERPCAFKNHWKRRHAGNRDFSNYSLPR